MRVYTPGLDVRGNPDELRILGIFSAPYLVVWVLEYTYF